MLPDTNNRRKPQINALDAPLTEGGYSSAERSLSSPPNAGVKQTTPPQEERAHISPTPGLKPICVSKDADLTESKEEEKYKKLITHDGEAPRTQRKLEGITNNHDDNATGINSFVSTLPLSAPWFYSSHQKDNELLHMRLADQADMRIKNLSDADNQVDQRSLSFRAILFMLCSLCSGFSLWALTYTVIPDLLAMPSWSLWVCSLSVGIATIALMYKSWTSHFKPSYLKQGQAEEKAQLKPTSTRHLKDRAKYLAKRLPVLVMVGFVAYSLYQEWLDGLKNVFHIHHASFLMHIIVIVSAASMLVFMLERGSKTLKQMGDMFDAVKQRHGRVVQRLLKLGIGLCISAVAYAAIVAIGLRAVIPLYTAWVALSVALLTVLVLSSFGIRPLLKKMKLVVATPQLSAFEQKLQLVCRPLDAAISGLFLGVHCSGDAGLAANGANMALGPIFAALAALADGANEFGTDAPSALAQDPARDHWRFGILKMWSNAHNKAVDTIVQLTFNAENGKIDLRCLCPVSKAESIVGKALIETAIDEVFSGHALSVQYDKRLSPVFSSVEKRVNTYCGNAASVFSNVDNSHFTMVYYTPWESDDLFKDVIVKTLFAAKNADTKELEQLQQKPTTENKQVHHHQPHGHNHGFSFFSKLATFIFHLPAAIRFSKRLSEQRQRLYYRLVVWTVFGIGIGLASAFALHLGVWSILLSLASFIALRCIDRAALWLYYTPKADKQHAYQGTKKKLLQKRNIGLFFLHTISIIAAVSLALTGGIEFMHVAAAPVAFAFIIAFCGLLVERSVFVSNILKLMEGGRVNNPSAFVKHAIGKHYSKQANKSILQEYKESTEKKSRYPASHRLTPKSSLIFAPNQYPIKASKHEESLRAREMTVDPHVMRV